MSNATLTMITTTYRNACAAGYVRSIQGRLDLANTTSEYTQLAEDITRFLGEPGAALLAPSQLRNLNRIRARAMRLAAGQTP